MGQLKIHHLSYGSWLASLSPLCTPPLSLVRSVCVCVCLACVWLTHVRAPGPLPPEPPPPPLLPPYLSPAFPDDKLPRPPLPHPSRRPPKSRPQRNPIPQVSRNTRRCPEQVTEQRYSARPLRTPPVTPLFTQCMCVSPLFALTVYAGVAEPPSAPTSSPPSTPTSPSSKAPSPPPTTSPAIPSTPATRT